MSDQDQQNQNPKSKGLLGRLFGSKSSQTNTKPNKEPPQETEAHPQNKSQKLEGEKHENRELEPRNKTKNEAKLKQEPTLQNQNITQVVQQTPDHGVDETPTPSVSTTERELKTKDQSEEPAKHSWFKKLTSGLSKTSTQLSQGITGIFTKKKLGEQQLEDLEDVLLQADLGVETALRITETLAKGRYEKGISAQDVRAVLAAEVNKVLQEVAKPLIIDETKKPYVILVVGVNGSGKTTTIGKLASTFASQGKKVMLAAGDTFRAAAVEQLKVWGERTNSQVIARETGADSSGLAFDALKTAQKEQCDVLLIDTAGRLQNKQVLMEELEKVVRVLKKVDDLAPHSVILVLDATTGQNAMQQVEVFMHRAGVTGLIMTKLDGTARGGILVSISAKYALPVHAIGVGEGVDDLQPFDAAQFADAIAQSN